MATRLEYIGFTPRKDAREYTLRVTPATGGGSEFTLVIDNEAFLAQRVRYQDGPEICYLKLQRELSSREEGTLPALRMHVTDAELEEYRLAHAPKSDARGARLPLLKAPDKSGH